MTEAKNLIEEHESLKEEVGSLNELLEEANTKITEVVQLNEELQESAKTNEEALKETEAELADSESKNAELQSKVNELTHEDDALEKKVSEALNEVGVDPVSLDSQQEEVNHKDQFQAISDPVEKTNFYRKHKEKILGGQR